jgi:hypothetical protein
MAHPLHESSIMAHSRYSRPLASFAFLSFISPLFRLLLTLYLFCFLKYWLELLSLSPWVELVL